MDDQITRFLNWAGTTRWTISPAIAAAYTVGWTLLWRKVRGS
jgi:hypothetical protein